MALPTIGDGQNQLRDLRNIVTRTAMYMIEYQATCCNSCAATYRARRWARPRSEKSPSPLWLSTDATRCSEQTVTGK